MSDFIITLIVALVISVALVFLSRNEAYQRRLRRRQRMAENLVNSMNGSGSYTEELLNAPLDEEPLTAEQRTRKLIGDEQYEKMADNVDRLLKLHRADSSINVQLTAGPDTPEGAAELHKLLPGDPLWLRKTMEGGMEVVDVYSGGFRIGRLLLHDASKVMEIMQTAVVTGSYVSEQNCYGDCDDIALGIIVFHSTQQEYEARKGRDASPWMITIEGPQRIVLYQN